MHKLLNRFLHYHTFVFRLAVAIMKLIFENYSFDMVGKRLLNGHVTN